MQWLRRVIPTPGSGKSELPAEPVEVETERGQSLDGREPVTNDAAAYGVRIEPAMVLPGVWYWQAISVHHLTPAENNGGHHIYVDVLQDVEADGGRREARRLNGARVRFFWDDGDHVQTIDGRPDEPGTGLPLWREQVCSVEVLGLPGANMPSDHVVGIHTGHPGEGPGNSQFRHSFGIVFKSVRAPRLPLGAHPIRHYVLFGPPDHPATIANLLAAQDYFLAFRPAFGFSVEEAANADLVTIVADRRAVSLEVEERLAGAGCAVRRIQGSAAEVAGTLADCVARGEA